MKNRLRQVISNKDGICIQVVDGKEGLMYTFSITWRKLEAFAKKHGVKVTLGDTSRAVSRYVRDVMESDG